MCFKKYYLLLLFVITSNIWAQVPGDFGGPFDTDPTDNANTSNPGDFDQYDPLEPGDFTDYDPPPTPIDNGIIFLTISGVLYVLFLSKAKRNTEV
jgi:hypothetical protein